MHVQLRQDAFPFEYVQHNRQAAFSWFKIQHVAPKKEPGKHVGKTNQRI